VANPYDHAYIALNISEIFHANVLENMIKRKIWRTQNERKKVKRKEIIK
jgi:hypothetical protein